MLNQGRIHQVLSVVGVAQVNKKKTPDNVDFCFTKGVLFTEFSIGPQRGSYCLFLKFSRGGGGGGWVSMFFQGCPNAYFYAITIFSQFFSHFIAFRDFILSFMPHDLIRQ